MIPYVGAVSTEMVLFYSGTHRHVFGLPWCIQHTIFFSFHSRPIPSSTINFHPFEHDSMFGYRFHQNRSFSFWAPITLLLTFHELSHYFWSFSLGAVFIPPRLVSTCLNMIQNVAVVSNRFMQNQPIIFRATHLLVFAFPWASKWFLAVFIRRHFHPLHDPFEHDNMYGYHV